MASHTLVQAHLPTPVSINLNMAAKHLTAKHSPANKNGGFHCAARCLPPKFLLAGQLYHPAGFSMIYHNRAEFWKAGRMRMRLCELEMD